MRKCILDVFPDSPKEAEASGASGWVDSYILSDDGDSLISGFASDLAVLHAGLSRIFDSVSEKVRSQEVERASICNPRLSSFSIDDAYLRIYRYRLSFKLDFGASVDSRNPGVSWRRQLELVDEFVAESGARVNSAEFEFGGFDEVQCQVPWRRVLRTWAAFYSFTPDPVVLFQEGEDGVVKMTARYFPYMRIYLLPPWIDRKMRRRFLIGTSFVLPSFMVRLVIRTLFFVG